MTNPTVAHPSHALHVETNTDMSGTLGGLQDIASAYKAIALETMEKMAGSVQAFAAVKSPTDFFCLQQKMMRDNMAAAMRNGTTLTKLTAAVFTARVAPLNQRQTARSTAAEQ